MEMMCGRSFRHEGSPLRKKIGRSNSSLLDSEFLDTEITKLAAYERLSSSMRLTANADDFSGGNGNSSRRNKVRVWSSLMKKAFSFRKRVGDGEEDVCRGEGMMKPAAKAPEVMVVTVAAEKKIKKSAWFPDPHRRWPVQGW